MLLALRVIARWWRRRQLPALALTTGAHDTPPPPRSAAGAAGIGVLHGVGGSGAIALLLLSSLPSSTQAALALCVFAPMSVVSMALCTGAFAALVERRGSAVVGSGAGLPALSLFALAFGGWYAGVL